MKKLPLALAFLISCLGQEPQPTSATFNGTINGTLTGDDGTAVSGALVELGLLSPSAVSNIAVSDLSAISGADGSFQFAQLASGSYRICVQDPGTNWLNPCEWGLQPLLIVLTSDQPNATVAAVLKKGAVVPIRLSDPSGFLSQYEGTVPSAQVLMGVRNDALFFRRATITSVDATGRNHQILIPFGVSVNLIVASSGFQLSNAAGAALPKTSASIPILVEPGQQPVTVTFVVTGGGLP